MPELTVGTTETQFRVNQKIVYPLQGVGHVKEIQKRDFRGKTLLYYQIYLKVTDMTVMVPVDKAVEIGIRKIVEEDEAHEALRIIGMESEPLTTDWKLRYQMNLDLLKHGAVTDIALVVRNLYHRSKVKELPVLERKLYDSALKILVDEITFSLEKPQNEVEELIFSKLEIEGS